jgi:hypothetical protein
MLKSHCDWLKTSLRMLDPSRLALSGLFTLLFLFTAKIITQKHLLQCEGREREKINKKQKTVDGEESKSQNEVNIAG